MIRIVKYTLIVRIILSSYIILDKILIKIFYFDNNKDTIINFFLWIIYYNIQLWLMLPFYLILKLYENIIYLLYLFEKDMITIKQYVMARMDYMILSVLCIMLLHINRISIIICIWVIDEIITAYYNWYIKYWNEVKLEYIIQLKKYNYWKKKIYILTLSFSRLKFEYNMIINLAIELEFFRKKNILLFKGLYENDVLLPKFNMWYYILFEYYWNNIYLSYRIIRYLKNNYVENIIIFRLIIIQELISSIKINNVILLKNEKWKKYFYIFSKLQLDILLKNYFDYDISLIKYFNEHQKMYYEILKIISLLQVNEEFFKKCYDVVKEYNDLIICNIEDLVIKEITDYLEKNLNQIKIKIE